MNVEEENIGSKRKMAMVVVVVVEMMTVVVLVVVVIMMTVMFAGVGLENLLFGASWCLCCCGGGCDSSCSDVISFEEGCHDISKD